MDQLWDYLEQIVRAHGFQVYRIGQSCNYDKKLSTFIQITEYLYITIADSTICLDDAEWRQYWKVSLGNKECFKELEKQLDKIREATDDYDLDFDEIYELLNGRQYDY